MSRTIRIPFHNVSRLGNGCELWCEAYVLVLLQQVATVMELGSGDPALANQARVKFTVRTAGVYLVSITISKFTCK